MAAVSLASTVSPTLEPLLAGLDGLAHGVAVFDIGGELRYANAAARTVLARLGWHSPRLQQAADREGDTCQRLAQALHRVCRRGLRELFEVSGGEAPVFAALVPVQAQGQLQAFVTFGRQELCGTIELQMFASRYGLTVAESQVLAHLVRGLRTAEIARAHGVAATTVLTQISAIRNKTLFKSVRELLEALSKMPPMSPAAMCRSN